MAASKDQAGRQALRLLAQQGIIMDLECSRDIWVAGMTRAMKNAPRDGDSPTLGQLYMFGLGIDHHNNTSFNFELAQFHERANMANRVFKRNPRLPRGQADAIIEALVKRSECTNLKAILEWRKMASEAEKVSHQLLAGEERAKTLTVNSSQPSTESEECIVCMEDSRSVVYRPCLHRVCCSACATELWSRSRHCPWCRGECEEP